MRTVPQLGQAESASPQLEEYQFKVQNGEQRKDM
jgi:hypothetical protein